MIVHAKDIHLIDERFGQHVGDYFLSSLVSRFEPTKAQNDIIGRLDRETYVAFLRDRTRDEARLIGRRMCGSTLLPLQDSAERLDLSAFVGFAEVYEKEPILNVMERANIALVKAQSDQSTRLEMWTGKLYPT